MNINLSSATMSLKRSRKLCSHAPTTLKERRKQHPKGRKCSPRGNYQKHRRAPARAHRRRRLFQYLRYRHTGKRRRAKVHCRRRKRRLSAQMYTPKIDVVLKRAIPLGHVANTTENNAPFKPTPSTNGASPSTATTATINADVNTDEPSLGPRTIPQTSHPSRPRTT